ncbi:MAG: sugar phosphate isomerase/epimerase [Oscillospiraceae bacterium]|nr:sugar phosphate isomerase/epimerase [Oscillospiraceae bacterium]
MKLGISSSCCFDWSFEDIYTTAKDLGYTGLEIRRLGDSVYAPRMKPFLDTAIDSTITRLKQIGIEIPILSSSAVLGKPDRIEEALAEVKDYCQLAERLNTPYVRVLAGSSPDDYDCDMESAIDTLIYMCGIAAVHGVSVLVETNSIFSDVTILKQTLELTGCSNLGVVWDINYPYRYFDESPSKTVGILGEYIKYVHTKDSLASGDSFEYRLMGHGDLPIDEVLRSLKNIGYTGYLTFEWVRSWNHELVEPGIVIAQYISYMLRALKNLQ